MSSFKKSLLTQFADIGKAMSNINRLEMLELLAQCEYSVDDLSRVVKLTAANTSQHLQMLRYAGLVTSRREGQRIFYRLTGEDVSALLGNLRGVAEQHLTEVNELVDTYLTSKDEMEPMPRSKLIQRTKAGDITVLDVRPPAEYAAGHLPGAINIPATELAARLAEFDSEQEIVAYCRGPYCVLAFDAVKLLRDKGFKALRLQEGYPEWKGAGLPVERSTG